MHARTHAQTHASRVVPLRIYLEKKERKISSNAYKQFYNTYYIFKNFTTYLRHTNTNDCTPPPPPPLPTLCPLRNDVHARTNKKSPPPSHVIVFEAFCLGFIIVEKEEVLY